MQSNLKPMAISYLTRSELELRLPLSFVESEDALGKVSFGTPKNLDAGDYKIRIYEASPKPSTEFLLNPDIAKDDLDRLLRKLGLSRDELFWIHPKAGGTLRRHVVDTLHANLERENPLVQIVVGPRQVGKTTSVQHLIREWPGKTHYATADAIVDTMGRGWRDSGKSHFLAVKIRFWSSMKSKNLKTGPNSSKSCGIQRRSEGSESSFSARHRSTIGSVSLCPKA